MRATLAAQARGVRAEEVRVGAGGTGPLAVQLPLPAHLISASGGRGSAAFPLAPGYEWELVVLLLPTEGGEAGRADGAPPGLAPAADRDEVHAFEAVSNVARVSLGACALRVVAGGKGRGGRLAGASLTEILGWGGDLSPREPRGSSDGSRGGGVSSPRQGKPEEGGASTGGSRKVTGVSAFDHAQGKQGECLGAAKSPHAKEPESPAPSEVSPETPRSGSSLRSSFSLDRQLSALKVRGLKGSPGGSPRKTQRSGEGTPLAWANQSSSAWENLSGIGIAVLPLSTLKPERMETFPTGPGASSEAAAMALLTEASPKGGLDPGEMEHGKFLVCLTCGAWSSGHVALAEATMQLASRWGATPADAEAWREAAKLGDAAPPVAMICIPGRPTVLEVASRGSTARVGVSFVFHKDLWQPVLRNAGGTKWRDLVPGRQPAGAAVPARTLIKELRNLFRIGEAGSRGDDISVWGKVAEEVDLAALLQAVLEPSDCLAWSSAGEGSSQSEDLWAFFEATMESLLRTSGGRGSFSDALCLELLRAGTAELLQKRIRLLLDEGPGRGARPSQLLASVSLLVIMASGGLQRRNQTSDPAFGRCPQWLSHGARSHFLAECVRRGVCPELCAGLEKCFIPSALPPPEFVRTAGPICLQMAEQGLQQLTVVFRDCDRALDLRVPGLRSHLPLREKLPSDSTCGEPWGVVVAEVRRQKSPFELKNAESWGPGWGKSGELLYFHKKAGEGGGSGEGAQDLDMKGKMVLIPPGGGTGQDLDEAITLQASRLVWLAQVQGAACVAFTARGPTVEALHPSPNTEVPLSIPSIVLPEREIEGLLAGCADWTASISELDPAANTRNLMKGFHNALTHDLRGSKCDLDARTHESYDALCGALALRIDGPQPKRPDRARILCIDGGGSRGLAACEILRALEETLCCGGSGAVCLADFFDLVVGVSAGGLTCVCIACGMAPEKISELYSESCGKIFGTRDSLWEQLLYGPGTGATKVLSGVLVSALKKAGPVDPAGRMCDLASLIKSSEVYRGTAKSIPAVCLASRHVSREPPRTVLFRSYPYQDIAPCAGSGGVEGRPKRELQGEHTCRILEALRSTSAAPFYLEECLVRKDLNTGDCPLQTGDSRVLSTSRYIDGATDSNNPSILGVLEARRLWGYSKPLVVCSVGTGNALPRTGIKSYPAVPGVVLQNLTQGMGDTEVADAAVEAMLGPQDAYFRWAARGEVYSCDLGAHEQHTLDELVLQARQYMKTPHSLQKCERLRAALGLPPGPAAGPST